MNKLITLIAIASISVVTQTASAQDCQNGMCRTPAARNADFSNRSSFMGDQRLDFINPRTYADGKCGLRNEIPMATNTSCRCLGQCPDCRNGNCRCNEQECSCAPCGRDDRRVNVNETRNRDAGRYQSTNVSMPSRHRNNEYQGTARNASINWGRNFDDASQLARQYHRPMLVCVTADWCKHCTKMKQETLTDSGVVRDIDRNFVPVYVDADQHRRLVERLGVTSLPATLVVSPDMRIVDREQGFRSVDQLSNVLRRHLQRAELQLENAVVLR